MFVIYLLIFCCIGLNILLNVYLFFVGLGFEIWVMNLLVEVLNGIIFMWLVCIFMFILLSKFMINFFFLLNLFWYKLFEVLIKNIMLDFLFLKVLIEFLRFKSLFLEIFS